MSEETGFGFVEALRQTVQESNQSKVARAAGIGQSTLSRILSGERDPGLRTIEKILKAYPNLGRAFLPVNIPDGA